MIASGGRSSFLTLRLLFIAAFGGASFLCGNFVGVYLKRVVRCTKTKCLGQIAEELKQESGFLFMLVI